MRKLGMSIVSWEKTWALLQQWVFLRLNHSNSFIKEVSLFSIFVEYFEIGTKGEIFSDYISMLINHLKDEYKNKRFVLIMDNLKS